MTVSAALGKVSHLFRSLKDKQEPLHEAPHSLAGENAVQLTPNGLRQVVVEDWFDRCCTRNRHWYHAPGLPVVIHYATRVVVEELPRDGDVVYVKCANGLGHIAHASELIPITDEVTL